jgi:signal transduction histidine kinase
MTNPPAVRQSPARNPLAGQATPRQSLRTRLAIWNAAVVILTAVTTLFVLRQGVTWALYKEINEILGEDVNEIRLMLAQIPREEFAEVTSELKRKAEGHRQHGWFVELQGEHNEAIWSSKGADAAASADVERLDPQPALENPHGIKWIVVGASLTRLQSDLSTIDELVVLTATLIVAIAPVFAYWLAGRATNAVGEITRTASRLRPDRLEERLPIRGTGDELDQLAQTINGLLDRIAVFLEHKRDVLANAAHELRTPLAAIRSSVEVALNEERTPHEYQEILEDIIDQGGSLQTLLNQLLLLSEAETEQLKTQVEIVELIRIVSRAAAMFEGVAEMRGIAFEAAPITMCRVAGNQVHLQQLVNNLIDNALKYTPAGGHVQVSLTHTADRKLAELRVKDSGVGIAKDDIPRVFDRFFRVDRTRSRGETPDGSGLGLSICRAVVEAHGGTIMCNSTLGKGSEFIVHLRLADPVSNASARPDAAAGDLQRIDLAGDI